jgi:hypothetical protein
MAVVAAACLVATVTVLGLHIALRPGGRDSYGHRRIDASVLDPLPTGFAIVENRALTPRSCHRQAEVTPNPL